jgi:PAS domain S-box-containing protein
MEENYRIIAQNSTDFVVLLDKDKTFTYVSFSIEKEFGYSAEEIIGTESENYFEQFVLERTVINGKIQLLMNVPNKANDKRLVVESTIQALMDENNMITGYVMNGRDVTAREQLIGQLKKSLAKEKKLSELKSHFISMASHEFRTPLATILSSGEIISSSVNSNIDENVVQKINNHVERICNQAKKLSKMTSDILLLETHTNSQQNDQFEIVYFLRLLTELIAEYFSEEEIHKQLLLSTPKRDFRITTNPLILANMLKNLIENALKYSSGTYEPVELTVTTNSNSFLIQIKDHGIGIPERDQKNIFNAFYRGNNVTNIKGNGLGLSIVREFSIIIGAIVKLVSNENEGTTISIEIPYER